MNDQLSGFFNPKGIIVVGASRDPNKLGYGLARNLVKFGYKGIINFVNPKGGKLFGRNIYKSISEVPYGSSLAVLLISSKFVLGSLKECKEYGINSVIISSGGFREIGKEGAKLEYECLEFAKNNGMRFMGPNCIGLLDTHLPLNTTFLQEPSKIKGEIAFISHSGAICAAILDWASNNGLGFSKLISLGNQADVNETDVMKYVSNDKNTKVITMYLEGVSNGREFVNKSQSISKEKPIIALKVGRFESGKKAVASHTGALAGQETAFNAAFRRAGVLRAESTEEMFDWAQALANCSLPISNKVAILTNAGGPGVTAADAIEADGLELAELSEKTKNELFNNLPKSASVENPVDMLASASPIEYAKSLNILLKDPSVAMAMIILPPPPMFSAAEIIKEIIPVIQKNRKKPVIVVPMGGELISDAVNILRDYKIPEFRFPEKASSAMAALFRYSQINTRKKGEKIPESYYKKDAVKNILKKTKPLKNNFLDEVNVQEILEAYKIPFPKIYFAKNDEEAVKIANRVGYPVVLKVASNEISHKSDVGGVILNINNNNEIEKGFKKLKKIGKELSKGLEVSGVYVQKMYKTGQEVILGALQDAQFGGLVMFGSGGTEVEGIKDICFSLAPLNNSDIDYMFNNTWAGKKLDGFRNLVPADKKEVEETIVKIGHLISDFPQLSEIEINPLLVLPRGQGVVALDVRIKI